MPNVVAVLIPVVAAVVAVADAVVAMDEAMSGVTLTNRLFVAKLLTGGIMPPGMLALVHLSLRNACIASGSYNGTYTAF
jgi:hypothetical protein